MVSYHGYWNYQDLLQSYDLEDKRRYPPVEKYNKNSVYGHLCSDPTFKIMVHLVKTANLDKVMDNPQFNMTLFACKDQDLLEKYGEKFFMSLDRSSALSIVNYNMMNRMIKKSTLLECDGCLVQTRKEESQVGINVFLIGGDKNVIINGNTMILSPEIVKSNGLLYLTDNLLIPSEFSF